MLSPDYRLVRILVDEEIERAVSEAAESKRILRAGPFAGLLLKCYPNSGLTGPDLVNEIALAASHAGVAVELGRAEEPRSPQYA